MFLAFNEMKRAKLRYGLIVGLLFLIAYLMFFLTALAYGLMQENRSAVDKWQADSILLTKDADASLTLSTFSLDKETEVTADELAPLTQLSSVAWSLKDPTDADKAKVSLLGIERDSFLMPNIVEGKQMTEDDQVVLDNSLAQEGDFQLGDSFYLSATDKVFTIVGYTDKASLSVTPAVYMTLSALNSIKYGDNQASERINALVVRGKLTSYPKSDLQEVAISTFINKLPGFAAQNMTFGFMIGFLIVISAIIIGIFMYILTIQKVQIFGVMKAQGISNLTISKAVLSQTFLLSLTGSSLGLAGTWLTSLILPSAVPFQINWFFYTVIFIAMTAFALLGTLFSVIAIAKIDPLKAIG